MKALVTKPYTDKYTGRVCFAGEEVELTEARAKELAEYIEVKEAPKKAAPRRRTAKKAE